jgi:hypothetical protein
MANPIIAIVPLTASGFYRMYYIDIELDVKITTVVVSYDRGSLRFCLMRRR